MGKIPCENENCEDGKIICLNCKGKEGNWDRGDIECEYCDRGEYQCEDCGGSGNADCEKCHGVGNLGDCEKCNGDGTLGSCKNKSCVNGVIKCSRCGGSGEKPKGQGKPLCHECAGLLDDMKYKLANGDYRLHN